MLVPGVWAKGTAAGTREINQHPGAVSVSASACC